MEIRHFARALHGEAGIISQTPGGKAAVTRAAALQLKTPDHCDAQRSLG